MAVAVGKKYSKVQELGTKHGYLLLLFGLVILVSGWAGPFVIVVVVVVSLHMG